MNQYYIKCLVLFKNFVHVREIQDHLGNVFFDICSLT